MEKKLLIIEDDPGLQNQMKWCFDESIQVIMAQDEKTAITALRRFEPQVVTLDLGLPPDPGGNTAGFSLLEKLLRLNPNLTIIVITGQEDSENAIKAIGAGAQDFYQKPIDSEILSFVVERAFRLTQLEQENQHLRSHASAGSVNIITNNSVMQTLCKTVEKIAPTDVSVMINGETGTGKELFARALHDLSPRKNNVFCAINCAAIPDNLLESELFGYEKGAFTGAAKTKAGKIESANGGTLFLDEVGDMPLALQAKLLRFLQERVIERIGSVKPISVDVRIVGATHRDLEAMIAEETFREDLYYRIGEITLNIPPLREREGDATLLANAFSEKMSQEMKKKVKHFSREAICAIEQYYWKGNIRELMSKVKRAIILSEQSVITPQDLGLTHDTENKPLNLREVREIAEREAIQSALNSCRNNLTQAASLLGITRPTLYNLLHKYSINPDSTINNTNEPTM